MSDYQISSAVISLARKCEITNVKIEKFIFQSYDLMIKVVGFIVALLVYIKNGKK